MAVDKEFLEKVYDKQQEMAEDISDIKVLLGKQEENLKLHIYRTELAEENIRMLRAELKPLENHVVVVHSILKVTGFLSILSSLVVGILKIIHFVS